jgi:hypothetical protein
MNGVRHLAIAAIAALMGAPSAHAHALNRSLAHAAALSKAALRSEVTAIEAIRAHQGGKAVSALDSAEHDLARATHLIARAPLDAVDVQEITRELRSTRRLDQQAAAAGPDTARGQLTIALSHNRIAITMIETVAADGGPVPE